MYPTDAGYVCSGARVERLTLVESKLEDLSPGSPIDVAAVS
jgi:hypothetical protein